MDEWENKSDENRIEKADCRVCDKAIGKHGVYLETETGESTQTFADIYSYLFEIEPRDGPQRLCWICSKALVSAFKLRKKIEDHEKVFKMFHATNGKSQSANEKKMDAKVIHWKPVKQEQEVGEDPMTESIVVKVEPSVPLEMEVSDDGDSSDGDSIKICKRKKKKKRVVRSWNKSSEGEMIQCLLCDYKSTVKDNYQKHVNRIHNKQEMKCDGCEEGFHLVYNLEEHRKSQHKFKHEYQVILKPITEPSPEQKLKAQSRENRPQRTEEGDLIQCPLCDYKSNVKGNYQKHVLRTHNRQEMKCDGCKEKFHLIYLLEEHREAEHDFTHPYVVDESLKLKTFERKFGGLKVCSNGNNFPRIKDESMDNNETSENAFSCPLCTYTSARHSRFADHYRKMHDNLEMTCDGCSGKFHLFYRLLEHRKLDHNFDHAYKVSESIILEDKNRKEQRRIEKGQNFPCPQCDRWFTEKRNVAKHLRVVHKYIKYKIPKMEVKLEEGADPTQIKKRYVYPTYKVICNYCGKLFPNISLENHIRNMHPEERDPYICAYCGDPSKTKSVLLVHMFRAHNFDVKIPKQQQKAANPDREARRKATIKTPQGTIEYICRYCPETFPFKISRKRHEIHIHTLQYPFTCELCDKKFIVKFEFKKHLERHMEGKRLSCSRCQTCGQHFTKRKLLERHVCANSSYPDSLPEHLQHFAAFR